MQKSHSDYKKGAVNQISGRTGLPGSTVDSCQAAQCVQKRLKTSTEAQRLTHPVFAVQCQIIEKKDAFSVKQAFLDGVPRCETDSHCFVVINLHVWIPHLLLQGAGSFVSRALLCFQLAFQVGSHFGRGI